jgi:transcription-repair coupling factor (superfamily II helicase)
MAQNLIQSMQLKWLGKQLGLEKISYKNGMLKAYFVPDKNAPFFKSEAFGKLLEYVSKNGKTHNLKQIKEQLILSVQGLKNITEVSAQVNGILSYIYAQESAT